VQVGKTARKAAAQAAEEREIVSERGGGDIGGLF
jgi:hypothetical protein